MSEDWKTIEIFKKNRTGRLMKIEENDQTRYQFLIWFEYTRQSMVSLKEGTFLAALNFESSEKETHYSVLELTAIKPIHYALGEKIEGYPGFVMEAARSIFSDWTNQEDTSHEDTTIIQCLASPTEHEIIQFDNDIKFQPGYSLPMIGSEVKILSSEATEKAVNKGLSADKSAFICGKWLVDYKTPILLSAEELLRVHFGIFGFTKAGKSNLLSTIISNILDNSTSKKIPVKIIIFDLMGEYGILLIDQLEKMEKAWIIGLGGETYPQNLIDYLKSSNNTDLRQNAVNSYINTSLYPRELLPLKKEFTIFVNSILNKSKIRLYENIQVERIKHLIETEGKNLSLGHLGNDKLNINCLISNLEKNENAILTETIIDQILSDVNILLNPPSKKSPNQTKSDKQLPLEGTLDVETSPIKGSSGYLDGVDFEIKLTAAGKGNLTDFKKVLEAKKIEIQNRIAYPPNSVLNLNEIINELNEKSHSSLIIVQSHDPHRLRNFSDELGRRIYESRRKTGETAPIISFIFDEADEFIPQNPSAGSSYSRSNDIAHMLARRGRKFGLGIGIATQRITYLNTSILAQPHTYFVSKLPRSSDRERIKEAFGFSDEILKQAVKFTIGDWILASYDATGLIGIPIPIHTDNANKRVEMALKNKITTVNE